FRWLERKQFVPRGTWNHLRTLPALKKGARGVRMEPRRKTPTAADVIKVAVAITRSVARLILLVQFHSGMRSGEVRGMRWSEIDRSEDVWPFTPAGHKNAWRGQSRVVALGPKAVAVLLLAREREPHSEWVFPCRARGRGRITGPFSASAYGRTVKLAAKR